MKEKISLRLARRVVLAAQGFAEPRPAGPIDRRHLKRVLARLGLLQIDSVSVLVRAHYMPLFSRLGPYPLNLLDGQRRRPQAALFEYWAHEASLLPVETYPLLRWRMRRAPRAIGIYGASRGSAASSADYVERVFREVEADGPIAASGFEGSKGGGGWWGWSDAKHAFEWLFWAGASPPPRAAASSASTTCPSACCRRRSSTRPTSRRRCPSRIAAHLGARARRRHRQPTCATISGCRLTT